MISPQSSALDGPWRIPISWTWAPLGDVTRVVGGGTPSTQEGRNFDGGTIPWITPADLSGYTSKSIASGARSITQKGLECSGAQLIPAGSVLFSSRAPIGYVAIASCEVTTNQGFKSFVPLAVLTSDFLYYYLKRAKGLAIGVASGTTFLELSKRKAETLPIPIPPVLEQRRIVEAIETRFTRLDAAIRTLQRVQTSLGQYRASLLNSEFPQEGTDHALASYVELSAVCDTATGGTPRRGIPEYFDGATPWVKSGELNDGPVVSTEESITQAALDHSNAKVFPAGTLCMALYGATVGRLGILGMDAATNQAVCAFFPKEGMNSKYLFWFLRSIRSRLLRQRTGGAQPNISQTLVRNLRIPLRPEYEQTGVIAEIERRLSVTDEVAADVGRGLERCARLRESILKMAFKGRLVPQDPHDEPAKLLMERIKQERPAPPTPKHGRRARATMA